MLTVSNPTPASQGAYHLLSNECAAWRHNSSHLAAVERGVSIEYDVELRLVKR